jgi:hypothetical protein
MAAALADLLAKDLATKVSVTDGADDDFVCEPRLSE